MEMHIPRPRMAPLLVRIVVLSLPPGATRGSAVRSSGAGCEDGDHEQLIAPAADTAPDTVCEGRRPGGLRSNGRVEGGCAAGQWLARMAHDEAASVHAFTELARELRAHQAPADLVTRARVAARDEVRHARTARRLAARHGVRAPRPAVERLPLRTLAEVALENAVEGCVHESFAALQALWQSQLARDPEVRDAMATIARDEVRHAELAWDVHAWADARLSGADRARVARAKLNAVDRLCDTVGTRSPALVDQLGLPTPAQGELLAVRMSELTG
jgi:hypothetical protein